MPFGLPLVYQIFTVPSAMSVLDQLKKYTTVVADTANFQLIEKYAPQDATTNPSLLFQAMEMPKYADLVEEALAYGQKAGKDIDTQVEVLPSSVSILPLCRLLPALPKPPPHP